MANIKEYIHTYIYNRVGPDNCLTLNVGPYRAERPLLSGPRERESECECERERAFVDRLEPSTTIVEFSAQSDPDTIFQ